MNTKHTAILCTELMNIRCVLPFGEGAGLKQGKRGTESSLLVVQLCDGKLVKQNQLKAKSTLVVPPELTYIIIDQGSCQYNTKR